MKRKRYSPKFKLKVVKEAIETGTASIVARNHQLGSSMVAVGSGSTRLWGKITFFSGKLLLNSGTIELLRKKRKKNCLRRMTGSRDFSLNGEVLNDSLRPQLTI